MGRHRLVQAGLAAGLVALTKAPLGLRPPALWARDPRPRALPTEQAALKCLYLVTRSLDSVRPR